MPDLTIRRAFRLGIRDGLPLMLVIVPFGMVFGVVAGEAGWRLTETMAMSFLVVAGASQFTALQLLSEHAPVVIVVVTALAVNLRLAMYSASLAPLIGAAPAWKRALVAYALTDQTYGAVMNRYALMPGMSLGQKLGHYAGVATVICSPWYVATLVGALLGSAVPAGLALDFAVPVAFIALVGPALRSVAHVAAALVSVVASLALAWMPYDLWLLVAAVLAMTTGALVETWQERRA